MVRQPYDPQRVDEIFARRQVPNPGTGQRDIDMMPLLMRRFAQKEPTFAVGMVASGGGRQIRVGDTVSVVA